MTTTDQPVSAPEHRHARLRRDFHAAFGAGDEARLAEVWEIPFDQAGNDRYYDIQAADR